MAMLLAAAIAMPARADEIASAKRKDGTIIQLTDEMKPACNAESLHGAARIQRGKTVQQACWGFDWKKRVFSVIPLAPRSMTQGMVKGVMRLLDGEQAAAWREMRSHDVLDVEHALKMKAEEFAWKKKAP